MSLISLYFLDVYVSHIDQKMDKLVTNYENYARMRHSLALLNDLPYLIVLRYENLIGNACYIQAPEVRYSKWRYDPHHNDH